MQEKKIAVIAVHGVSDQKPFDSARQVADLLINPKFNLKDKYSFLCEKFFRIPVTSPYKHHKDISEEDRHKPWIPDERGEFIAQRLNKEISDERKIESSVDIDLTQDYISGYKKTAIYDTIRLESKVTKDNVRKKVHVYEMYWADLSRLGLGFARIFGELYQLLFHLTSLGRSVVDLARLSIRENTALPQNKRQDLDSKIKWWGRLQIWNGRILTMIIPLLNLFLLAALFLSIPIGNIATGVLTYINYFGLTVITSGLIYFTLTQWEKIKNKPPYLIRFSYPFVLGIIFFLVIPQIFGDFSTKTTNILVTLEWAIALGAILYFLIIQPYDIRRPKTKLVARIILVISIPIFLIFYELPNLSSVENITKFSLDLVEYFYIAIYWMWLLFTVLYLITLGCGFLIKMSLKELEFKGMEKFENALRISSIVLTFPALFFLIITLSFWSVLNLVSSNLIPHVNNYTPQHLVGLQNFPYKLQSCTSKLDCFLQALSDFSATPFSIFFIILFIFVLLIALWTLFPAILTEISPPDLSEDLQNKRNKKNSFIAILTKIFSIDFSEEFQNELTEKDKLNEIKKEQNRVSKDLGEWLSKGYKITIISLVLFISIATPILFLIALILAQYYFFDYHWIFFGSDKYELFIFSNLKNLFALNITIKGFFAPLIAASAGSLIALGSRLNAISLGLRGVLDAALDVDNYLRLYPDENNPRARMFARYASLLNYIYNWQDIDGKKYDAIIIISHSQGTVMSADLLRLLQYYKQKGLSEIGEIQQSNKSELPIYLFTMGAPIRQLYSFAFPHLYDWVYNSETEQNKPNPAKLLNVQQWVNAYRSGDYIGRNLWQRPNNNSLWKLGDYFPCETDNSRKEFCIGAGAHTHYWDETAVDIAQELDRLINDI